MTQLGIGIVGDVLNNSGTAGHAVVVVYQIGNATTYPLGYPAQSLSIGQYDAFQFRVRRLGGTVDVAYRIGAEPVWTVTTLPATFPAANLTAPIITIGTGDAGHTTSNSAFKAKLDYVTIQQ